MLKSLIGRALQTLLVLAILAALASPASAQASVRYETSAAPDLYTAANYLGLSAQEFVDTSIAVHSFLLAVSGKTEAGAGCGQYDPFGDSGPYIFEISESQPLANVMAYYCFTESEAAFASTTLLVWLTALDANLRGVERAPVTPPPPEDPPDSTGEDDQPVEGEGDEDTQPKTYPDCTLGPANATPGTEPVTWTMTLTGCPAQDEGIDLPGADHCSTIGEGLAQVISWTANLLSFSCSSDPAVVWQRAAVYRDDCGQAPARRSVAGGSWSIRLVEDTGGAPALWEFHTTLDAGAAVASNPERAENPDPCSDVGDPTTFCNMLWPGNAGAVQRAERIGHAFRLGAKWSDSFFSCAGSPEFDASAFCNVTVHHQNDPFGFDRVGFAWPDFSPSSGNAATCAQAQSALTLWNGESICSIFGGNHLPSQEAFEVDITGTGTDVSALTTYGCK